MKVQWIGCGALALWSINLIALTEAADTQGAGAPHAARAADAGVPRAVPSVLAAEVAVTTPAAAIIPAAVRRGALARAPAPGSYFGIDHYLADRLEPVGDPVGHP